MLERLCLAVDFVHAKGLVLVDLKRRTSSSSAAPQPQAHRPRGKWASLSPKLTPFYAPPELAAAALETMRLGQIPAEFDAAPPDASSPPRWRAAPATQGRADGGAGVNQWGPNLRNLSLLSENPTLARQVAAASHAANRV